MRTKEVKDHIRERMASFARKDPRKFPDLLVSIVSRTRPSGHVFLVRGERRSKRIDTFNSIAELGLIIETICKEYRAKTP